jgi:hypothetical protein
MHWITYRLGPRTVLAKSVRRVKSGELEGYNIYCIRIFCLLGAILGMVAGNLPPQRAVAYVWLAFGLLLAAMLLEWVLNSTSGRSFSSEYFSLSLGFGVGSLLWMSSDRRSLLRHWHKS